MKRRAPAQPTLDELVFRGGPEAAPASGYQHGDEMPDPVKDPGAYEDMIREDYAQARKKKAAEAVADLPADVPRADSASPITDAERGVYFWQAHDYVPAEKRTMKIQLSSHVTPCTPKWCAACKVAFSGHCVCECGPRP